MELAMREIVEEGLQGLLRAPDPFAQAVYRLYRCPALTAPDGPRVVVVSRVRDWKQLDAGRRAISSELESEEAAGLLWSLLHSGGWRLGEVVYDAVPEPGDHAFYRQPGGYRVTLALPPSRVQPLAVGAA